MRRLLIFAVVGFLAVACSDSDRPPSSATGTATPAASQADPEAIKRVQDQLGAAGRLMQEARFDEALEAASAAIAITPDRFEPYEVLSKWYVQMNRHDLAIEAFERLSSLSSHGLRFLALHQTLSGDRDAAVQTLDRCVEAEPRHSGCRFERARMRQARGAFEDAVEDFRAAYAIDSDPVIATNLAEALRVTGGYDEIGVLVEKALEASPDSIELLLARARQQQRDRDDTGAFQTLQRVLELEPTSDVAMRMLGGLLWRSGNETEGRNLLGRAGLFRDYNRTRRMLVRGVDSGSVNIVALMMAELELTIGNYQDAQDWLSTAREAQAPAQRLAATEAWTWYALGDVAKGDAALGHAGGNDDPRANLARAARAARIGDAARAGQWLDRAIGAGPNERSFLYRAIDLYASIGDVESAESLQKRVATAGYP
jgi:tetratricopeptide (TPR) repeat protein